MAVHPGSVFSGVAWPSAGHRLLVVTGDAADEQQNPVPQRDAVRRVHPSERRVGSTGVDACPAMKGHSPRRRQYGRQQLHLGVCYNFTEFSDDLTDFDCDHKGWFLTLVGWY